MSEPFDLLASVQPSLYQDQVHKEGVKTTFQQGIVYRYPGRVPMLEVNGDHYKMGLQYGVLLRPEILEGLESFNKIAIWQSAQMNMSPEQLWGGVEQAARGILSRLPERFARELEGIAEGSGVPLGAVIAGSLMYDVLMGMRCTGLLLRDKEGRVIHARNNDTSGFGGEALSKLTVVVRHNPKGFHSVTHIEFILFLGVETGYSGEGLAFSEETLSSSEANPDNYSLVYLVRRAMEECESIDQLPALFDKHPVIGGYGTVWSDRKGKKGMVAELSPVGWASIPLNGSMLWNFNHYYTPSLAWQQNAARNLNPDLDREAVASTFPHKSEYSVNDALAFIRQQIGPEGTDYSCCGSKFTICNNSGSQAVIFDPLGDGFYLGVGPYYAARQNIYHYFEDFSRIPELFAPAVPLRAVDVEVAHIDNLLITAEEKRQEWIRLSRKFQDDAHVQFLAANLSFWTRHPDDLFLYAQKALDLDSGVAEHRLLVGIGAYQTGQRDLAIKILEAIEPGELYPHLELLRLYALEKACADCDSVRSGEYAAKKQALIIKNKAADYYEKKLLPVLS
jgi:hypothetical protein